MQIAIVAVGRMGGNMVRYLLRGHQVTGFDRDPAAVGPRVALHNEFGGHAVKKA